MGTACCGSLKSDLVPKRHFDLAAEYKVKNPLRKSTNKEEQYRDSLKIERLNSHLLFKEPKFVSKNFLKNNFNEISIVRTGSFL